MLSIDQRSETFAKSPKSRLGLKTKEITVNILLEYHMIANQDLKQFHIRFLSGLKFFKKSICNHRMSHELNTYSRESVFIRILCVPYRTLSYRTATERLSF
jgi:hypothetical protein